MMLAVRRLASMHPMRALAFIPQLAREKTREKRREGEGEREQIREEREKSEETGNE
jgi:hypothetical protein